MVDLYAQYLIAVSRRGLMKKIRIAVDDGYELAGNIERRRTAWRKWRATMKPIPTLPNNVTTRAIDDFIQDPSTGVRRVRPAA